MARRWVCIKACVFNRRHWDPSSLLEKDRVYVGAESPGPCFRELADGEKAPVQDSPEPRVAALSEIQKKGLDLVLS